MTISAVLLIPNEAHADLLAEGPCGSRPPTMYEAVDASSRPFWTTSGGTQGASKQVHPKRTHCRALVLAWDGEPVLVGCLPAAVALGHVGVYKLAHDVKLMLAAGEPPPRAWIAYVRGRSAKLGTLVFLDADGREVEP